METNAQKVFDQTTKPKENTKKQNISLVLNWPRDRKEQPQETRFA